jgi:hypothetical protein
MSAIEEYKHGRCTIRIEHDVHAASPLEDDNVGTMVCWHRHYNLGDEQPDESPEEYLQGLVPSYVTQPHESRRNRVYNNHDTGYGSPKRLSSEVVYALYERIDSAKEDAIAKWLRENLVILPLYLYDHSGLSISTGSFSCPWDSGQVGFIYCSLKKAQYEWGTKDSEVKGWDGEANYTLNEDGSKRTLREAATRFLEGEVEHYDQYLRGNCYGYVVEAEDFEEDSCWGFIGDLDYVKKEAESIADYHNKRMDEEDRLAAIAEAKEEEEAALWACRDSLTV